MVSGYAIIQLPEMLASTYAFLRKRFVPKAPNIVGIQARPPNYIKPIREANSKNECICSVDVNVLKLVKEEVAKAEMKMLDVMTRKLDVINNRTCH